MNYLVTSTNTCHSVSDLMTLTVNSNPTVNAGADFSMCLGTSISLGATGTAGVTFSWSPAAGLSSASIADPVASPATTTTYTVTVTDGNGCIKTDVLVITVEDCAGIRMIAPEKIRVYPSPFSSSLTIELGQDPIGARFELLDVSGRSVRVLALESNRTTIARGDLSSGVYFWKIIGRNDELIRNGKVVVE